MKVESKLRHVVEIDNGFFTNSRLRNEPNLDSCDLAHARELGGECVQYVIQELERAGIDINHDGFTITTRIHYLREGNYTWFPGWHCDGHMSGDLLSEPTSNAGVYIGHFGTANATVEFIDRDVIFPNDIHYQGDDTYRYMNEVLASGTVDYHSAHLERGVVTQLKATDIHRVVPSTNMGHRMLVIVELGTTYFPPTNQVSRTTPTFIVL